jgi:eukaryotic-like serine/threonine-protein kinase
MDDFTGRIFGERFQIETFIGRGGMADVYKVWDQRRAAYLAMKILNSDLAEDAVFLRRFKHEAQVLERLQHPNIVRFYGLEESDNLAYILMDYIDGLTLRKEIFLNPKGIRPARILQIMQPICSALHYAHQMGMVHCDVKPVNIMIQRSGIVFLADFGIARMKEARTQALAGTGTPAYMAPELFQGMEPTPAADIYALGMVLYEMLTGGERPFISRAAPTGSTTEQQSAEVFSEMPPPPSLHNPNIPPELDMVTMHCLERRAQDRYGSTLELLAALQYAVHGKGDSYDVMTLSNLPAAPAEDSSPGAEAEAPVQPREEGTLVGMAAAWGKVKKLLRTADKRARLLAVFALLAAVVIAAAALSSPLPREGLVMAAQTEGTLITHTASPTQTATVQPASSTPPVNASWTAAAPLPTVTSAPTITPQPEPTRLGGANGRIAFASDRNGSLQLWVMNAADPSDRQQLTNLQGGACQPDWSPDGKKIVFTAPCSGPRQSYPGGTIKILDVESGSITTMQLPGSNFDPAWSPDGQFLAYTTVIFEQTEIRILDLADGSTRTLARRGKHNSNPAWSPDGDYIAFISDDNGIDEIWLTRVDGSSQEVATQAGLLKYYTRPSWSPVNQKVIAASMKELNTVPLIPVLVLIDRDNPRQGGQALLKEPLWIEDTSFSPDGQWLVFWTRLPGNNMEILRANLQGEVEQLTDHPGRDFHPSWSSR